MPLLAVEILVMLCGQVVKAALSAWSSDQERIVPIDPGIFL